MFTKLNMNSLLWVQNFKMTFNREFVKKKIYKKKTNFFHLSIFYAYVFFMVGFSYGNFSDETCAKRKNKSNESTI